MTILILGGRISAGFGVSRGYMDILKSHYGPMGIKIINRSRIKETSFDGVSSFYEDIDPYYFKILLLNFGIDDAFLSVYRSEFKENLVNIVRIARKRSSISVLLMTSHGFDNLHDMESVHIYYRTIREVSVNLQCGLISVHTYWAGYVLENRLRNANLVQTDTRYPNEEGHKVIAQAVIRKLNRIIW